MKKVLFMCAALIAAMSINAEITEMTCAQAAEEAAKLEDRTQGTDSVAVTGYVTSTDGKISSKQQTFWMDDQKGSAKTFEGYWADLPQECLGDPERPLNVGDKIVMKGFLMRYGTTYEMKNGDVTILERAVVKFDTIPVTTCEAIAECDALADGNNTADYFSVTDVVTSIISLNEQLHTQSFYFTCADNSKTLQAYNVTIKDTSYAKLGDVVRVVGRLKKHGAALEIIGNAWIISKWKCDTIISDNEIWYTSSDGQIVTPYNTYVFGASIISNTYIEGKGVIKFDGNVTSIGRDAFSRCANLTSITIPDSVIGIGENAFSYCYGLNSIIIPNSVTSIGNNAFYECTGLTSVTIPNSVTSIGNRAFSGCFGLTSITIPDDVTSIGDGAFYSCTGLTSITIPNSVTSIGDWAFFGCTNLTSITIPNSVTIIGDYLFSDCFGLTSITIPDSVTSIGSNAFSWCTGLTSITIPNNATSIGDNAFFGCSGLNAVHITDLANWCAIRFESFNSNPLSYAKHLFVNGKEDTKLTIPEGVTNIGDYTFCNYTVITSVVIPHSVTNIGYCAFSGCSDIKSVVWNAKGSNGYNFGSQVENFTFGDSVQTIPNGICNGMTNLKSVTIGNSVTRIGYDAFEGCKNITSVTWNAKNCGAYNFGNQVEEFTFGDSVQVIPGGPDGICRGMSKLTSVTISNSVTTIGYGAFYGCSGLTAVHITDLANWCAIRFESFDSNPLYYAKHLFVNGKEGTKLTIPEGVTNIGDYTFYDYTAITSVVIPHSVTNIEMSAFNGCDSIKYVAWNAKNCHSHNFGTQVEQFTFGDSVQVIPGGICSGMSRLTSITIPNSVTSIGNSAFSGCSGLSFISIPKSVTNIGSLAFSYCGLDSIVVENGNAKYDSRDKCNAIIETSTNKLIQGCNKTIIPINVTSIGDYAFNNCTNLSSVSFGDDLTSIGTYAFGQCIGLRKITCYAPIPPKVTETTFEGVSQYTKTYVLASALEDYQFAIGWRDLNLLPLNVTITTNAINGTVTGAGVYEAGTTVILTATPNEHYHFVQWSDGNTENPRTIKANADSTYTAEFALDQFTLIVASYDTQMGSVTGGGTYDYGTSVTLSATPTNGYEFDKWNDNNTDNPRTILVTEDKTFVATFKAMTAIEDVYQSTSKTEKLFIDGYLYIIRDGTIYNAQGARVNGR